MMEKNQIAVLLLILFWAFSAEAAQPSKKPPPKPAQRATPTAAATPTQNVTFGLTWQDNSSGQRQEDGSYIERCTGLNCTNFVQVGKTGTDVTTTTDTITGDPGNTVYCYRVKAYNAAGISGPSNVSCSTSPSIILVPIPAGGATVILKGVGNIAVP